MSQNAGWLRFYERMIDSPQVMELSDAEFRLLVSLWCVASAQRERGTIPYSSRGIQRRVLPDHPVADVEIMLTHLLTLDLLQIATNGYAIPRWDQHQYQYPSLTPEARREQKRKDRQQNSNDVASSSQVRRKHVVTSRKLETEQETETELKREEGSHSSVSFGAAIADAEERVPESEPEVPSQPVPAPQVRRSQPVVPRAAASREPVPIRPVAPRQANPLWDAFVAELGYTPETKVERSNWGKAVRDLKEVGATPEEIHLRCGHYVARYGRDKLTVNALVTHWGEVSQPPPRASPATRYIRAAPDAGPDLSRIAMTAFDD